VIRPVVDLLGQLEVGRGDAEPVGAPALAEDLVAFAVLDLEHDRLIAAAARLAPSSARARKCIVCPGLVDRFVGREQDPVAALELESADRS